MARGGLRTEALALLAVQKARAVGVEVASGTREASHEEACHLNPQRQALGFLCHLRASGKLFLFITCHQAMLLQRQAFSHACLYCFPSTQFPIPTLSASSLCSLKDHPALASPLLREAAESGRLVATLHLSPHHVASTPRYRAWMQQLPGKQVWGGKPGGGSPSPSAAAAGVSATPTPSGLVLCAAAVLAAPGPVSQLLAVTGIVDAGASGAPTASIALPNAQPLLDGGAASLEAPSAPLASSGAPAGPAILAGPAALAAAEGLGTLSPYELRERHSMGFRASARTSCKLSMVSAMLFPLPFVLRPRSRTAFASRKRREPGCCPALASTSVPPRSAGCIDIPCSDGSGAHENNVTAVAAARTQQEPQRDAGRQHQQLELGGKATKVVEAGLLWRLHLELPSRLGASSSVLAPGQPLMDVTLAPECVDPQAVRRDVAEAKGGDLEQMIKVGLSLPHHRSQPAISLVNLCSLHCSRSFTRLCRGL